MSKATRASVFALALAAVPATGCEPEVPANPTYERDVKPIFYARCVRCHDEMFRGDPVPTNPSVDDMPLRCHLNRYDNAMTDCSDAAQAMLGVCSFGAALCTNTVFGNLIRAYAFPVNGAPPLMPPAPAPPLNEWEMAVVDRWMSNPDPATGMPLP